ncbi:MAG: phage portal protein [Acidobacteria bacterium]|nr:phage portal protein [Acidobacteriota bacterium]
MPETDLQRAYTALNGKTALYAKLLAYYDGEQPLLYTAQRLKEIFKGIDAYFAENWCVVVIDAVLDRLVLEGWTSKDKAAAQKLELLWKAQNLAMESADAHEGALVCGESFVVCWPDDAGIPQAYYNDPRLCHVFYRAEDPRSVEFAAKWWIEPSSTTYRLNLYYADRIEHYETRGKADSVSSAAAFTPIADDPEVPNPFGFVPVFHLRPSRRVIKSDLVNVIPLQNGINKLLTDMMVSAEFGAFRQRWVIANTDVQGKLKNAPNEIWMFPAGDGTGQQTQVGQFEATNLTGYLDAVDKLANAVAVISKTPKHFLFGQGGTPSGEALMALEAPLNKRVYDRISRFSATWSDVAAALLAMSGVAVPDDITTRWAAVESIQPRTEAEIIQLRTQAGMPLTTAMRLSGADENDLDQLAKDQKAESAAAQATLAQALLAAQRRVDGGGQA